MQTTDFFGRQQRARQRTYVLVLCLILAVVAIITAIYLALVLVDSFHGDGETQQVEKHQPLVFAAVATVALAIVFAGGLYTTFELHSGEQMAGIMGKWKIDPATETNAEEQGRHIAYFAAVGVLLIAAVCLALLYRFVISGNEGEQSIRWYQPQLFAATACYTLAVIVAGSLYKTYELRRGEQVATMLGGQRIDPATGVLAEQQIRNVVEEMAIASGVAVPPVYLLKNEFGINALAAGFTADDAVICISQGALDYLNRDELQGIVAHEFSHILNGDMRFNLRLIGLLHGILLIGLIGQYLTLAGTGSYRASGDDDKKRWGIVLSVPILLFGFALFVIGYLGLFVGRLIKAAVTRQREYLADASAVQFTRNPQGIAGALKKIGGLPTHSYLRVRTAETASHMFFESACPHGRRSLFATHPPLVDRVRAIDVQFDGRFPKIALIARDKPKVASTALGDGGSGQRAASGAPHCQLDFSNSIALDPAKVIAAVGAPSMDHVEYASHWLASLPKAIATAVRDPFSARCVVFALLLDRHTDIRQRQVQQLTDDEGEPTRLEIERLAGQLAVNDKSFRLPLIVLAQGTLRQLSPAQYERFRKSVHQLSGADEKMDLFEFVTSCVLLTHLDRAFGRRAFGRQTRPQVHYYNVRGAVEEVAVILSALARVGHRDTQAAEKALQQAIAPLQLRDRPVVLQDAGQCTLARIQAALRKLATCSLSVKKRVLSAATLCVVADGRVTVAEAELLRAIAHALDCPIPPIIPGEVKQPADQQNNEVRKQ